MALGLLLALGACASNDPWRDAGLAWNGQEVKPRPSECDRPYADTDALIWREMQNPNTSESSRSQLTKNVNKIIRPQLGDRQNPIYPCWRVSYENHQGLPLPSQSLGAGPLPQPYDLLIAEFDDQGERTDVSRGKAEFANSEVALIEAQLDGLIKKETARGGGVNIIVFTHGWHGSAVATDDYSIWLKSILQQIAYLERASRRSTCRSGGQHLKNTDNPAEQAAIQARMKEYGCPPAAQPDSTLFLERRTIGIEIAWRGDSEVIPLFAWANFWDRKGAAQMVGRGGVHDLMARIHKLYLAHSCHARATTATPNQEPCDAVHLLTVGHSFGALIDYHVLDDEISTGLLGDRFGRAYGFGDMTVLLNPAFEGERESTLIEAALHRTPYPEETDAVDGDRSTAPAAWPPTAQMPSAVTLQSKGDWATHYAFPFARFFTSLFENDPGANEYSRSLNAAGWIGHYKTHELVPGNDSGKDDCDLHGQYPEWFCPFDLQDEEIVSHPFILKWGGAINVPALQPLWTVMVDTAIMKDHDDISNPAMVRFIAELFRTAYEQEDRIHETASIFDKPNQ